MINYLPIAKPERELSKVPNLNERFKKELWSGRYVGGKNVDTLESSLCKFFDVCLASWYHGRSSDR